MSPGKLKGPAYISVSLPGVALAAALGAASAPSAISVAPAFGRLEQLAAAGLLFLLLLLLHLLLLLLLLLLPLPQLMLLLLPLLLVLLLLRGPLQGSSFS